MIEFRPVEPGLLSDIEACRYLRLDDDGRSPEAAVKALNRLVDQRRLTPCLVGRQRRYALAELQRFIADETDKYRLCREGADP